MARGVGCGLSGAILWRSFDFGHDLMTLCFTAGYFQEFGFSRISGAIDAIYQTGQHFGWMKLRISF
jgi:hypothetical protein